MIEIVGYNVYGRPIQTCLCSDMGIARMVAIRDFGHCAFTKLFKNGVEAR